MSDDQPSGEYNVNSSAHEPAEPIPNIDWPSETFSEPHDFGEAFNSPDETMTSPGPEFADTSDTEASEPHNFDDVFNSPDETMHPPGTEFSATPDAEVTVPIVGVSEEKGKKKRRRGKKKKKEQHDALGQRKEWYIEVVLSFCFFFLTLISLSVLNVLIFTVSPTPGIGSSSTLYYAIGVNVFGLIFVIVPFMFWRVNVWKCYLSKSEDEDKNLHLFDVLLGIALMALVIGVLCLLTVFYRYDFMLKPP